MALLNPEDHAAADSAFVVELELFSGPLDLLLTLIREEQVEITDVPVARIAEQFLHRVHALGLAAAAEYLEMAARLLRIKAQILLPRGSGDEDWDDPRAELVRRLLEYQQMREVVEVLDGLSEGRRNRFERGYRAVEPAPAIAAAPLALSLPELLGAVDRILRLTREPGLHDVVARALDVDGAIDAVRTVLAQRPSARWGDVVPRGAEPWQVLSALLALLELARRGEVRLLQPRAFGTLEITRDAASEAA